MSNAVEATTTVTTTFGSSTIFLDKRVFQIQHVPNRIVHRERQISRIQFILKDLGQGVRARNILCIGDFGTGKTAVVRFICRDLPAGTCAVYTNCSDDNTSNRIFKAALRSLGVVVKSGFPKDHYLELLKETLKTRAFLTLILDEVDKLVEKPDSDADEFFYTLMRTFDNVVVVMLTNRVSLEATLAVGLDSRVKDTFRFERIEFEDYNAQELAEILADRCKVGFREGTYDAGIVAMISRAAYERGLRARGVIDLARKAGEIAEAERRLTITEQDVRLAVRETAGEREMNIIRHLPPVQHAILAFILAYSPTSGGLLKWWSDYATIHHYGPSPVTLHGYIKELDTMGLVTREKRGLGRGRGVSMTTIVPPELVHLVSKSLEPEATPSPISEDVNRVYLSVKKDD